jgi:hypothetical protein
MTKIETEVIERLASSQASESLKQSVLRLLASHGRTTANHKACLEKIKELNSRALTEATERELSLPVSA